MVYCFDTFRIVECVIRLSLVVDFLFCLVTLETFQKFRLVFLFYLIRISVLLKYEKKRNKCLLRLIYFNSLFLVRNKT